MDSLSYGLKSSQIDVNADVDRLARRFSETYLPTDIGVDDQRPEQDHHDPSGGRNKDVWIHFQPGTTLDEKLLILGGGEPLLQRRPEHGVNFTSTQNVQNAMSTHLHRLPTSSNGAASLTQDAATYNHQVQVAHPLPSTSQVLEELSRHMADEVYKRYRLGFAPTLAPLAHPYYPFWMPTYGGNYAIEALVRREEQEALDRQAKDGEKENARYR